MIRGTTICFILLTALLQTGANAEEAQPANSAEAQTQDSSAAAAPAASAQTDSAQAPAAAPPSQTNAEIRPPLPATVQTQGTPKKLPVTSKWDASLYGFVEADSIWDSTESFNELAANGNISRKGTYAGNHSRLMLSVRNSRIGFKLAAPEYAGIKASAIFEMDFLGNQPTPVSEAGLIGNPTFRIRHAALKMEDPIIDILAGQYWQLFGWQSYFHPNTVELQGVPGQIYSRAAQIRLSHNFKSEPVNFELAVAAARPPQRDSAVPDGQAGLKLSVNDWKGLHTSGATGTSVDAAAIGVSGVYRQFAVTPLSLGSSPDNRVFANGWGLSVDALIPVIPATTESRANALTLTGSFVRGDGISDLYSGLTGGAALPTAYPGTVTTANPNGTPYPSDLDNGMAAFDSKGKLKAIAWRSFIVGLQYYLPPSGKVWLAVNYSQMNSPNISSLGAAGKVFTQSRWADGNLFWDITPAVRVGAEYAWFSQTYGDGVEARNHRAQLSFFYLF